MFQSYWESQIHSRHQILYFELHELHLEDRHKQRIINKLTGFALKFTRAALGAAAYRVAKFLQNSGKFSCS